MTFTLKKKLTLLTVISSITLMPMFSIADDTIPIEFKEGDVISAEVFNTLLERLNNVQKGFVEPAELDGKWSCKTTSINKNDDVQCEVDGLLFSKVGVLEFTSTENTWSYSSDGVNTLEGNGVESCGYFPSNGSYDVRSNHLVTKTPPEFPLVQVHVKPITRISPTSFRWIGPNDSIIECEKMVVPPSPVNELVASASGTDVLLSWLDTSDNETGFTVERKALEAGAWTSVITTADNETSYSDVDLTTGIYMYRVIATNDAGDAMSSSVVQVEIL